MRRVIVNSTPLIALSNIGKLEILKELYKEITIPFAVYKEVTEKNDTASKNIQNSLSWIHVENIRSPENYGLYKAKLHAGEIEVMILAQEQDADLVILDDDAAKKTAKYLGLTTTGTLGILIKAKKEGKITAISPILDDLVNTGFFISDKVKTYVLEIAEEM